MSMEDYFRGQLAAASLKQHEGGCAERPDVISATTSSRRACRLIFKIGNTTGPSAGGDGARPATEWDRPGAIAPGLPYRRPAPPISGRPRR